MINPDKNSNNSSTPPSKERMKDEVIRRTRSLRKPSGKKPGGQKGHDGHKLSCSSIPDEIIDEVPNYCIRCGESLSDSERVLDYVTQVISIPELKPVIKEILSELNTEQEWSGKVTNLFREAIHERNTNPNDVIELKPVIKEIRHYVMICKNCGERIRTIPRRRSNNVVYDSSVKTLVVYLSVVRFLPYGSHSKFFT